MLEVFLINFSFPIFREVDPAGTQSATVSSPNVTMMITDRTGNDITAAQVGDALALRFEIIDENSWVYL